MNTIQLTLLREGLEETRTVESGVNLLEALQGFEDFDFDAPCGGNGTCGKCRVLLEGSSVPSPCTEETKFLSPVSLEKGERLACMVKVTGDLTVTPLFTSHGVKIVTEHKVYAGAIDSPLKTAPIILSEPSLQDQRCDAVRFREALKEQHGIEDASVPLPLLEELMLMMRKNRDGLKISTLEGHLWGVLSPEAGPGYGIAIDIGTTTVVAYLVNLSDGDICRVVSGLNMQKAWGGDVISRVQAASESGPEPLQRAIARQISTMVFRLVEEEEIPWEDLRGLAVAGNTVMMHLLAGVDPRHIAVSPFIPVFTEKRIESSYQLFPRIPRYLPVILLPSISGFIGADITAGIAAAGLMDCDKPSLLIDVGTNGELVIGDSSRMIACSTAAGPAFEGATISCGLGGIPGAVSVVTLSPQKDLAISTIAGETPAGICGSGIIDLASLLIETGIVDYTGRLLPPDELPENVPSVLASRVTEDGFIFATDRHNQPLIFTPRDVREVQLAKASVAAGIDILLEEYGIGPEKIDKVFLAGGFGSFINTASAVGIGLLPGEIEEKIVAAGNTAGAGAVQVLLSEESYMRLGTLASKVEYIELSASPKFQDRYVEQMFFPQ